MADVTLVTNDAGQIILPASHVPVFIVISDSRLLGTLGSHRDEDRIVDRSQDDIAYFAGPTPALQYFDQAMYENTNTSTWDTQGSNSGGTFQGRNYLQNGVSGFNYIAGRVRPRASSADWAAASFRPHHMYTGLNGNRPFPANVDSPLRDTTELNDNNPLYSMATEWFGKFNNGATVAPHFIHYGVSGSVMYPSGATVARRASWWPDYALPSTSEQVGLWHVFHDMYLKPALDDLITNDSLTPVIMGMIVAIGGNDSAEIANNNSSFIDYEESGGKRAKDLVGPALGRLADNIETALGVTNLPTLFMDVIESTPEEPIQTPFAPTVNNQIHELCDGDAYRYPLWSGKPFDRRYLDRDPHCFVGSDGIHLSHTGANKFGAYIVENYNRRFVDQPTPLVAESVGAIASYLTT